MLTWHDNRLSYTMSNGGSQFSKIFSEILSYRFLSTQNLLQLLLISIGFSREIEATI